MKKLLFSTLLLAPGFAAPAQTQWTLDKAHTSIRFEVSHMAISAVGGQFHDYTSHVAAPADDFENAEISLTIEAASIDTDNERRDEHLRSEDFLYVDEYPEITFTNGTLEKTGENQYVLKGDLTLRGVTKPVSLNAEHKGTVEDPSGALRAGFRITGAIDRFDFGIDWNNTFTGGLVVGREVDIICDVEVTAPGS